MIPIIANR